MGLGIFNPRDPTFRPQRGAVPAAKPADFFIRPGRGLSVRRARLMLREDSQTAPTAVEMTGCGIQNLRETFCARVTPPAPGLYWYSFELSTPQGTLNLCPGAGSEGELRPAHTGEWQLTVFEAGYETPEWLKGGLIYQIFPDRFFKEGSFPENVPSGRVLREDWGGEPVFRPDEEGKIRNNDYFGGNLRGITAKLGYLKSLGVTALYLNPIFEAHSNHRYNTADYRKIDPLLGNEEDFRALCEQARQMGMRVILDGVFNHTGDDSVYFNRCHRYPGPGAYESRQSPYYPWYCFSQWPEEYDCWWGFNTLPAVNECSGFADFIAGEDGVLAHWLKAGASGFRLDVADELSTGFLERIRSAVRRTKPDGLVIGEVWEDASNKCSYGERRHYFQGHQLDGVMNYPFRNAILGFLRDGRAAAIHETVASVLEHYPAQSVNVLMNLLGTHDTERIITALAGEPANGRDREWKAVHRLSPEARMQGIRLVKLAAALQYCLPGVPCVYYGDEAGLEGYDDPFNRRCFPWGGENVELLEWYRTLGQMRAGCPALRKGAYEPVAVEGTLYAFLREDDSGMLLCAVNAGQETAGFTFPEKLPPIRLAASCGEEPPVFAPDGKAVLPPLSAMILTAYCGRQAN